MKESKSAIKPVLVALAFFILIAISIYWLWQRQPKLVEPQPESAATETIQEKIVETQLEITPADGSVLKTNSITFEGKAPAGSYVVISSNNTLGVTLANENGAFEIEAELTDGINLINAIALDQNLADIKTLPLTLYVNQNSDVTIVLAGAVKSIFDDLITITTPRGEQTIRQKSSTKLTLPKTENDDEDSEIRVGDFLIALGTLENEKDFNTNSIEVIRENKPQNNERYAAGMLLTKVNENIFSVRNQKDAQIVEFTLSKDTIISSGGEDAQIGDITKDKKTIVIYFSEDGENIVDLIYLIP